MWKLDDNKLNAFLKPTKVTGLVLITIILAAFFYFIFSDTTLNFLESKYHGPVDFEAEGLVFGVFISIFFVTSYFISSLVSYIFFKIIKLIKK